MANYVFISHALFILEITLKINFTELPQLTLWDISDIINFYLSNRDKNGKFLMSNLDLNKKKKEANANVLWQTAFYV